MKTTTHFSSKNSALVLGTVFTLSIIGAGVTLAQGLNIPTNLANAAITIQKIFLSPSGTSTELGSTIILDGLQGNITTKSTAWGGDISVGGNISASGNITLWWDLQFTKPGYQCPSWSTGCNLKVNSSGLVIMTNELSGGNDNVFKRKAGAGNEKNIYLANTDGSLADVGNAQSYLRVGSDDAAPTNPETAMVVAGKTESRGGLLIRRDNDDGLASNQGTNKQTRLSTDFTELDLNTQEWKVRFVSKYDNGINPNWSTSFIFSADGATTKVGINTVGTPQATLDVNGSGFINGTLAVWYPTNITPPTDTVAINGNTRADAYYYNSDCRYKSDIEVLTSPLANLLKISGYSYYSKLEKKDTLGVIAQEVEAVYPELVQTDAEWYKSAQYGNLIAPIIEAIRELSTKVDNLFTLYVSQQAAQIPADSSLTRRTGEAMTNCALIFCAFSLCTQFVML
jgi:Chaperone of endosialidase